jgi:hypothetical protein
MTFNELVLIGYSIVISVVGLALLFSPRDTNESWHL